MAKKNKTNNNSDNTNSAQKILTDEELGQIENMIQVFRKNKEIEFEVSFRNINYPNYLRIVEHYVNLVDEDDISSIDALDVSLLSWKMVITTGLASSEQTISRFFYKNFPKLGLPKSKSIYLV